MASPFNPYQEQYSGPSSDFLGDLWKSIYSGASKAKEALMPDPYKVTTQAQEEKARSLANEQIQRNYTDSFSKLVSEREGSMEYEPDSGVPLNYQNAQNTAQRAADTVGYMTDAHKAIQDAISGSVKMGFGKMVKGEDGKETYQQNPLSQRNIGGNQDFAALGFKADPKRRYATEKDVAGNIIAITPLAKAGEDPFDTSQAKGWTAPGYGGGAGSPFTPNLDKFQAKQDTELLAATMAGQNPSDVAQMRGRVTNAANFRIPQIKKEQEARAQKMRDMGINPDPNGAPLQNRPSAQMQNTTATYDPTSEANAALAASRAKAEKEYAQGQELYDTYKDLKGQQEKMSYGSGATMSSNLAYQTRKAAEEAGKQSTAATKRGMDQTMKGAKEYTDLMDIPKTTLTQSRTPYGDVYSSAGSIDKRALDKAKKNKIFDNPNQTNT